MKRNISQQQIYWRIGAGIATLWWASRPRRSGLQRTMGAMVGATALASGVTGYSPIMDILGMECTDTNTAGMGSFKAGMGATAEGLNDGAGADQYLTESSFEDIGTEVFAGQVQQAPGRTLFRFGDYAVQKMPRQTQKSLWGVPQDHDGVDYPASVTPDSTGWSWDELVDNE